MDKQILIKTDKYLFVQINLGPIFGQNIPVKWSGFGSPDSDCGSGFRIQTAFALVEVCAFLVLLLGNFVQYNTIPKKFIERYSREIDELNMTFNLKFHNKTAKALFFQMGALFFAKSFFSA